MGTKWRFLSLVSSGRNGLRLVTVEDPSSLRFRRRSEAMADKTARRVGGLVAQIRRAPHILYLYVRKHGNEAENAANCAFLLGN